jgi:hypothetical protein
VQAIAAAAAAANRWPRGVRASNLNPGFDENVTSEVYSAR